MKRRIFQWFTATLFVLCLCAIYANLLVDDAPVRAQALQTAKTAAGCGDKCKLDSFHGERGMLQMRGEYDIEGKGHWTVICRRAFIVGGEYKCTATGAAEPK
ncbi:MAG: hypothetical protein KIT84_14535 [Labilithrix sp.]|nr:hypothetical protein [Labilithrix sp.]MCW5812239.1 hypothetical protein [Labilithrix sp.]